MPVLLGKDNYQIARKSLLNTSRHATRVPGSLVTTPGEAPLPFPEDLAIVAPDARLLTNPSISTFMLMPVVGLES